MLSLLLPTAAADFTISPEAITLELIAGDTTTVPINITWSQKQAVVYIDTIISPDPEGINVTYTNNPIVIDKGETIQLFMTITTDPRLIPDQYTIETKLYTTISESVNHKKTYNDDTENEALIEIINNLQEELRECQNNTEDCNCNCTDMNLLLNQLDDLIDQIDTTKDTEQSINYIYIILPLIVIFLVVTGICYYFNRCGNNKNPKGGNKK